MQKMKLMMGLMMLVVLTMFAVQAANAQGVTCAHTGTIEQQLTDNYGETLRDQREAPVPGGTVFLWSNGTTGNYSVLINPQPGVTCIIDAGQSDSLKEQEA